jgi:hypothetical protein
VVVQQVVVNQNGAPVPAPVVVQAPVAGQAPPALPPPPRVAGRPLDPRMVQPYPGGYANGQIVVQPGTPKKLPTVYAGAVRVRAVPEPDSTVPRAEGEKRIYLEVRAEPRLQNFIVTGTPQVRKAVDDHGQVLTVADDAASQPVAGVVVGSAVIARAYNPYGFGAGPQTLLIKLKGGDKAAKTLKELAGTLTAQVLTAPEPLLKVDHVLKAAGKAVKGENGGSMEVLSISKQANGDYKVQLRLENPPGGNPFVPVAVPLRGAIQRQQIQIQVNGGGALTVVGAAGGGIGGLSLLDAKGKAYQLVEVPSRSLRGVNGVFTQEMTLVFRPQAGQGEPASLVLNGRRTVTVSVPFRLTNVLLR